MALLPSASGTECGKWYSSPCLCDEDVRYCKEGENGASDDIQDQHPFWKKVGGYYRFTNYINLQGLFPFPQNPEFLFSNFPSVGYLNYTLQGSRSYYHQYRLEPLNPNVDCSMAVPVAAATGLKYDGECGINGRGTKFEQFATSSQERDGSMQSFGSYIEDTDGKNYFNEYRIVPSDEKTLFTSAKGDKYMLVNTWTVIDDKKTRANSILDVFVIDQNVTTLAYSVRREMEMISEDEFVTELQAKYEELAIPASERAPIPMTTACINEPCPTEEEFRRYDPRFAATQYSEPDATVRAGPIAGIVVAVFVVLTGALYLFHLKILQDQAAANRAAFARRIASTIKLEGPGREVTPEALAEQFRKIDNGCIDGNIDKAELRAFLDSGSTVRLSEANFEALFAALDTDGDGTVSFMEFSAYLGNAQGEFDTAKKSKAVLDRRGMDQYYMGVSQAISKRVIVEEEGEEDEEN